MGKRRREVDSDGEKPTAEEYNTVFVDTSLDTHLAVLVSSSDTVSDFKNKVVLEHVQCFPKIGAIRIHSLKVKRRGNFYHLPDIMRVWSAFQGVKGNWFLSADTSRTLADKKSSDHGTNDGLIMDVRNRTVENCRDLYSDLNRLRALELALPVDGSGKKDISEMTAGLIVQKSSKRTSSQTSNYSMGNCVENESRAKKKLKMKHNEDVSSTPALEGASTLFLQSRKDILQSEIVDHQNSIVGAIREAPESTAAVSGARNDQPYLGNTVSSLPAATEKSNLGSIANSKRLVASGEGREDLVIASVISDHSEAEIVQNVQTVPSDDVAVREQNLSGISSYANGTIEDASSGANKKKRRAKKTDAKVQGTLDVEHDTRKGGNTEEDIAPATVSNLEATFNSQILVASYKQKNDTMSERGSMEDFTAGKNDFGLNVPVGRSDGVIEEPSCSLMDTTATAEDVRSNSHKKKKKKARKTAEKVQEASGIENETREGERIEGISGVEKRESEKTSNSQILLPSDQRKEYIPDLTAEKSENEFGHKTPTKNLDGVILEESNMHARVTDASGVDEDSRSDACKNKKKSKKAAAKIQDTSDMELDTQKSVKEPVVLTESEKSNLENITCGKIKEHNLLEHVTPKNLMTTTSENVPYSKSVGIEEPNLSSKLHDTSVALEDAMSNGIMKKKKKSKKAAADIQDTADKEHETRKDESIEQQTETNKLEKGEEQVVLSLSHDQDLMLPPDGKVSAHFDPNLVQKVASFSTQLSGADVMEPERFRGRKKKKSGKECARSNPENSDMEQIDSHVNGTSQHIREESDKGESILHHKGRDAQVKLSDIPTVEKAQEVNGIGEGSVILTQAEKNLENVISGTTKTGKRNQTLATSLLNVPVMEKENQVAESDQTENRSENTRNNDKKVKRKGKKREHTESDVQENLPSKDQKTGAQLLAAVDNSGFVIPAENGQLDKSKEKSEVKLGTAVGTDDLSRRPLETESQAIDFKQYFVPGKNEDKVVSGNKIEEASKSNQGLKTGTNVKKHVLQSVSTSAELHNSQGNQESEQNSRLKNTSRKKQGDSALHSASRSGSLGFPGKKMEDSNPKESRESTTILKRKPSSSLKEQKTCSAKPSLEKSENVGNKKLRLGLNVTNYTGKKSLENKSLFKKPGGIFQDNSDENSDTNEMATKTPEKGRLLKNSVGIFQYSSSEGSGDEKGRIVNSDASTHSPSDSSSLSGAASDSDGELSVDSTRNGSGDANGTPAGGKSMSKLNLSASQDMTIDMILRSSKRFKKAKLIASQELEYESQDMEFVPESQPYS